MSVIENSTIESSFNQYNGGGAEVANLFQYHSISLVKVEL